MDTNMSIFNQINSLCYWFQHETHYHCALVLDSEKDSYYIRIKDRGIHLYTQQISNFSKKSKDLLRIELTSIAESLVLLKGNYVTQKQTA
ncbi:MAG: hypothetical protein AAFP76_05150 [Bacteroidota bacterium]